MSHGIEITFLSVPKPPDPLDDEFFLDLRIAAVTYKRRHPECWPDRWKMHIGVAPEFLARHPECKAPPATMTTEKLIWTLSNENVRRLKKAAARV